MKQNHSTQHWLSSAAVGLALLASPSLGVAANITYSFDSDAQGWYSDGSHGSIVWDGTHGRGGNGCLKCTIVGGTDTEIDPQVAVAFDTGVYFDVEFDIMCEGDGRDSNGNFGNLQAAARDASGSFDGLWYGAMTPARFGTWRHVKLAFNNAYGLKAALQLQIQSQGSTGYTGGDVTVYIDNVVLQDATPPNHVVMESYTWPEEANYINDNWGKAQWPTNDWDNTLHTNGALRIQVDWNSANAWTDLGDIMKSYESGIDMSKFTWVEFDMLLQVPAGYSRGYGQMEVHFAYSSARICTIPLSSANVGVWTHYKYAVPAGISGAQQGLVFHPGVWDGVGTFYYYIDNIVLWKEAAPPTLSGTIQKETSPQGVKITMDDPTAQYQRESICVPTLDGRDYSWVGRTPISYSFTLADFPAAGPHYGFEAHLFIVNESTIPDVQSQTWNETFGACDWNAADLLVMNIENRGEGGVYVRLNYKTNTPAANCPDTNRVVNATGTTAVGTWTLTFDTDSTGTITGPGGFSASFTLPDGVATRFDPNGLAASSFIQFGIGKNQNPNDGRNNNASGSFSAISMNKGLYAFNETFPGPGLSGSGLAWRTTSATAVNWVPSGTGLWLTWSTPDAGFNMKVAGSLAGPWNDAGVTYTYQVGNNRIGAVPAANLPAGNAAFFRLVKP